MKLSPLRLQALVFSLVAAAFTTIYVTQPVLPVLQEEFGVSGPKASLTVSAVIFGVALANLPFGWLADRLPVKRLILTGGLVVSASGLFCAATLSLPLLVGARCVQGLFIPALTTCLAAYLSRNLPLSQLNVVMGSYVSATVVGGLGGRLLGGWIHPPLHWRYALVTASLLVLGAALAAVRWLPAGAGPEGQAAEKGGFRALLKRRDLWPVLLVPFGAFFVYSSIFNYLPFYLAGPPFNASTQAITFMYLVLFTGILISPLAGKLSNRIGSGGTMILGVGIFALAILITLIRSLTVVMVALVLVCAGFFAIHAAAAGALNRKLTQSRGLANSLYVLLYYLGGSIGITLSGYAFGLAGWGGVAALGLVVLALPLTIGLHEVRQGRGEAAASEETPPWP
jgi:YNFM family putative membrane transporter